MVFLNSFLGDTRKKNVMTASGNVPSTCSGSWSSNVVMIVVPRESSSFSVEIAAAVVVGTPIYSYTSLSIYPYIVPGGGKCQHAQLHASEAEKSACMFLGT